MGNKQEILTSTNVLFVEGKDEINFFTKYLEYIKINNVQIYDVGGKDKFKKAMYAVSNMEKFNQINKIGFIRDADESKVEAVFTSICDIITGINTKNEINIPVPEKPGEIKKNKEGMSTGIFIMPDNKNSGMLEDLCLKTIESNDKYVCVNQFISCIFNYLNDNEKKVFKESKARVLSYLATCAIGPNYINSLGLAAQKSCWDLDNSCLTNLKIFINNLYSR